MQHLGPDEAHKRYDANHHTDDIDEVVPVSYHLARTAAILAALLIRLYRAREGACDERALEVHLSLLLAGMASGCGQSVHEAEDEVAGECTAEVADAARC